MIEALFSILVNINNFWIFIRCLRRFRSSVYFFSFSPWSLGDKVIEERSYKRDEDNYKQPSNSIFFLILEEIDKHPDYKDKSCKWNKSSKNCKERYKSKESIHISKKSAKYWSLRDNLISFIYQFLTRNRYSIDFTGIKEIRCIGKLR